MTILVIQEQSTETETSTVAPIVTPFTFDGRKLFRMLGWCGLNTTQDILIPLVWRQLNSETTKTENKALLTHLLELLNVGDEEVNIFLNK